QILRLMARLAETSVLIPHPTLIKHRAFGDIASRFRCIILNAQEAALVLPEAATSSLPLAALQLRRLAGAHTGIIVTNGPRNRLRGAAGNWNPLVPQQIGPCNAAGAGDTSAACYAEGRYLRGLEPDLALERALTAVALFLAARPSVVPQAVSAPALHFPASER